MLQWFLTALRIICWLRTMAFEVLWNQVFICLSDLPSCHDNLDDASKIPVFTFPKYAAPAGCQPPTLLSLLLSSIFISHYSAFSWNVTSLATFSLTIWPKEQSVSSQHPIYATMLFCYLHNYRYLKLPYYLLLFLSHPLEHILPMLV